MADRRPPIGEMADLRRGRSRVRARAGGGTDRGGAQREAGGRSGGGGGGDGGGEAKRGSSEGRESHWHSASF